MNQGEREAEQAGNPYAWNTPEWHIWNEGLAAGRAELAQMLASMKRRTRALEPRDPIMKFVSERMR